MALNESNVRNSYLTPELLPDSQILNVAAGTTSSPAIIDLRRLQNKYVQINDISVEQSINARLEINNDKNRYLIETAGLKDQIAENFNVIATDFMYTNIYAAALLVNYRVRYNLWIYTPTIAHKILYNKSLTSEEQRLADALDIFDSVKKGLLPLPFGYMIQREYPLVDSRRAFTFNGNVFTFSTVVQSIPAGLDEIVVLEEISAAPGLIAENIRIRIDRDDAVDYLDLQTFPMALTSSINCFVVALRELRIKVISNINTTCTIRYVIAKYRLTDVLRVRFGLVSRDEVSVDTYDKVKGGVL